MQLPRSVQLPAPAFVWLPARSAPARSAQLLVGSVWLLWALALQSDPRPTFDVTGSDNLAVVLGYERF